MQLHTDRAVGRPITWPHVALASRGAPRLARTPRPEPDGLSAAELRRIVAEVLG